MGSADGASPRAWTPVQAEYGVRRPRAKAKENRLSRSCLCGIYNLTRRAEVTVNEPLCSAQTLGPAERPSARVGGAVMETTSTVTQEV